MKKRFSFLLVVGILVIVLVVAELFSQRRASARLALSATATHALAPTETLLFERFPTRPPVTISPTSIPLQATYTSIVGETPNLLATPTLLPIDTPTLLSSNTPPKNIPTATLIFFPSLTSTPFGGSPTPPVAVAYSLDDKPRSCYKGPSLAYIEMDTFKVSRIAGKDLAGAWWFLLVNKGQGAYVSCWVARNQVSTGGNLDTLPVVEPELSDITQVKVSVPGQPVTNGEYVASIACDDGITKTTLHFFGQVFANGPLEDLGYRWDTDAPVKFKVAHGIIQAWDLPAESTLELPVPSKAAVYSLSLRTTFPAEAVGGLQVIVRCE